MKKPPHKKPSKQIIGKVYANWCGHCKALKEEWPKFKNIVHSKGVSDIDFIEIEESEKHKLDRFKHKHNIQVNGYPTIFRITPSPIKIGGGVNEKHHIEYYNEKRDAYSLSNWALNGLTKVGGKKKRMSKKKSGKRLRKTMKRI